MSELQGDSKSSTSLTRQQPSLLCGMSICQHIKRRETVDDLIAAPRRGARATSRDQSICCHDDRKWRSRSKKKKSCGSVWPPTWTLFVLWHRESLKSFQKPFDVASLCWGKEARSWFLFRVSNCSNCCQSRSMAFDLRRFVFFMVLSFWYGWQLIALGTVCQHRFDVYRKIPKDLTQPTLTGAAGRIPSVVRVTVCVHIFGQVLIAVQEPSACDWIGEYMQK